MIPLSFIAPLYHLYPLPKLGFVDGIEFHNSSSTGKNCIKGAVSCDQSDFN